MQCPECQGPLISPSGQQGETVCQKCGLVVQRIRTSQTFAQWAPEWFSNWDQDDSDTLREWLTTLRTISCQLNLPNFPYREEAARIIRTKSSQLFRSQRFGKNKREAVAALMHLILKEYNEMRPLKEICETLNLDHHLVYKYAWTMRTIINLNNNFTPRDYLKKYGAKLIPDPTHLQAAEQILTSIQKKISGNPASIAAGALYLVCRNNGTKIGKDEIGRAFHISGRTVYSSQRRICRLIESKGFKPTPDTKETPQMHPPF